MSWSPLKTISGRIVLGFSVLIATFGGISAYMILNMRQLGADLRVVRGGYLEVSLNAAQLYTLQDGVVDQLERDEDRILRADTPAATIPALNYNRQLRRGVLNQILATLRGLQKVPEGRRTQLSGIEDRINRFIAEY